MRSRSTALEVLEEIYKIGEAFGIKSAATLPAGRKQLALPGPTEAQVKQVWGDAAPFCNAATPCSSEKSCRCVLSSALGLRGHGFGRRLLGAQGSGASFGFRAWRSGSSRPHLLTVTPPHGHTSSRSHLLTATPPHGHTSSFLPLKP